MAIRFLLVASLLAAAAPALAQSPNTAAIVVLVVDQTGGGVDGATVLGTNAATGATRELTSEGDGSAMTTALALTGTYPVRVSKPGFTADDVTALPLGGGGDGDGEREARGDGRQNRGRGFRHQSGRAGRCADRPRPRQLDDRRNAD